MGQAAAARRVIDPTGLFDRIGTFLADHCLACDPSTYAFVHAALSRPDGPLAAEIAELTEGGLRLSRADVERLGGRVAIGEAVPPHSRPIAEPTIDRDAALLVAETQAQVDGFADMMRSMQHETRGFGRDLAESAAAIDGRGGGLADLSRIASAMVSRVRESEARLAQATGEADALRAKLADAHVTARRDPLTGLPNRLAFAEAYAARRPEGAPHCLALCDIDRFKRINDEHGHGVGDRVLSAIGEALTEACQGQLVARHGGEEFSVLLAGVTLAEAARRLDVARDRVGAKRFRNRDTGAALGAITFSAGVIAIRADENAEQATERADRLLYTAKAQGRDRVCAA